MYCRLATFILLSVEEQDIASLRNEQIIFITHYYKKNPNFSNDLN